MNEQTETSTVASSPDGDNTSIDVRLVVAPIAGRFRAAEVQTVTAEGEIIASGGVIGYVDGPGHSQPVTSFCAGFVMRVLAESGERVRPGQPVAWLHPLDRPATRPAYSVRQRAS